MCAFSVSAFSRAVQVMEPSPIAAFIGHVSQERSSSAHLHKWSRASENKNVRTMQGKIFTFEKEKKYVGDGSGGNHCNRWEPNPQPWQDFVRRSTNGVFFFLRFSELRSLLQSCEPVAFGSA